MGVVDHKNCRCNVGHAKESNAEAIRIRTIHHPTEKGKFHVYTHPPVSYFSGLYNPETMMLFGLYNPDYTRPIWPVVCTTKKTFCKRFLTVTMAFKHVFCPSLLINRLQIFTISHTLFSSSFYNNVFSLLAFHRKRPI